MPQDHFHHLKNEEAIYPYGAFSATIHDIQLILQNFLMFPPESLNLLLHQKTSSLANCFCFLLVLTTLLDAGQIITGFPPATWHAVLLHRSISWLSDYCEWHLEHSFKTFCITRTYTKTLWFTLVEKLFEPFFWFFSRFCFFFLFFHFFLNYFNSGQIWPGCPGLSLTHEHLSHELIFFLNSLGLTLLMVSSPGISSSFSDFFHSSFACSSYINCQLFWWAIPKLLFSSIGQAVGS